jgi:hypothetical protein
MFQSVQETFRSCTLEMFEHLTSKYDVKDSELGPLADIALPNLIVQVKTSDEVHVGFP